MKDTPLGDVLTVAGLFLIGLAVNVVGGLVVLEVFEVVGWWPLERATPTAP